jgi:hypothetical protein
MVDRYPECVKKSLPAVQADDITESVRKTISSQIDDRKGDIGRLLAETDVSCFPPRSLENRARKKQKSPATCTSTVPPSSCSRVPHLLS